MATDPFSNIKFNENFTQSYYTELIIAKPKTTQRFCDITPTVEQSYQSLLEAGIYKSCEQLALPGLKPAIQLENKLSYKPDQTYTLYDSGSLDNNFRIQNYVVPDITETEEEYWKRVSAPLNRDWLQYYFGWTSDKDIYLPVYIRSFYSVLDADLEEYTDLRKGFVSGEKNNRTDRPNLYDKITLNAIAEAPNYASLTSQTAYQSQGNNLNAIAQDTVSYTLDRLEVYDTTTVSTLIDRDNNSNIYLEIAPDNNKSHLTYRVEKKARIFQNDGTEVFTSVSGKSQTNSITNKPIQSPPTGQTTTYGTVYLNNEKEYQGVEFTLSFYIYHTKQTFYYGYWSIEIAPKDANGKFTCNITARRPKGASPAFLKENVSFEFDWQGLGNYNLFTITYKFIDSYIYDITTGTVINNPIANGLMQAELDVYLNADKIYQNHGGSSLNPPTIWTTTSVSYKQPQTPVIGTGVFGVVDGVFSMIVIADGRLNSFTVRQLYSHCLRYENPIPTLTADLSPNPIKPPAAIRQAISSIDSITAVTGEASIQGLTCNFDFYKLLLEDLSKYNLFESYEQTASFLTKSDLLSSESEKILSVDVNNVINDLDGATERASISFLGLNADTINVVVTKNSTSYQTLITGEISQKNSLISQTGQVLNYQQLLQIEQAIITPLEDGIPFFTYVPNSNYKIKRITFLPYDLNSKTINLEILRTNPLAFTHDNAVDDYCINIFAKNSVLNRIDPNNTINGYSVVINTTSASAYFGMVSYATVITSDYTLYTRMWSGYNNGVNDQNYGIILPTGTIIYDDVTNTITMISDTLDSLITLIGLFAAFPNIEDYGETEPWVLTVGTDNKREADIKQFGFKNEYIRYAGKLKATNGQATLKEYYLPATFKEISYFRSQIADSFSKQALPTDYKFEFPDKISLRLGKYINKVVTLDIGTVLYLDNGNILTTYSYQLLTNNDLTVAGFTIEYTPNTSFKLSPLEVVERSTSTAYKVFGIYNEYYDNSGFLLSSRSDYIKSEILFDQNLDETIDDWYRIINQDSNGTVFNKYCFSENCTGESYYTTVSVYKFYQDITATDLAQIETLYSTGVDTFGQPIATGIADSHWTLSFVKINETRPNIYWKFNNTLRDLIQNLLLTGPLTPTYSTGRTLDKNGLTSSLLYGALTYDNISRPLINSGAWSITGWFRVPEYSESVAGIFPVFGIGGTTNVNPYFLLYYNYSEAGGNNKYILKTSSSKSTIYLGNTYTVSDETPSNTWTFFYIRRNSNSIKISINNGPESTITDIPGLNYNFLYDLKIDTDIDEVRFYNSYLSDNELDAIYNPTYFSSIPTSGIYIDGSGNPREYDNPIITNTTPLEISDPNTWPAVDIGSSYPSWWPSQRPIQKPLYEQLNTRWLSPGRYPAYFSNNLTAGTYRFKTTFNLTNFDLRTVEIQLLATADDRIKDIFINGRSTGLNNIDSTVGVSTPGAEYTEPRFKNLWLFKLPLGKNHLYQKGTNIIEIEVDNISNSTRKENPFGIFVAVVVKEGRLDKGLNSQTLWFSYDQDGPIAVLPSPITPAISVPNPNLTPKSMLRRSSDCIKLAGFTHKALGIINSSKTANYDKNNNQIIAFIGTTTPDVYGRNIGRFGFPASLDIWKNTGIDPNDSCGYRTYCKTDEKYFPFGTMAKGTKYKKIIRANADHWLTIQVRQTTPPPGYQLLNDNNSLTVRTTVRTTNTSVYKEDHIREISDLQSIYGKPTKIIVPPTFSQIEEYNHSEVDIELEIISNGILYEHYLDDIVIEYGPGYCDQLHCIDTFHGNEDTQKYLNTTRSNLIRAGTAEANIGTKYVINTNQTASQYITLGGYLNKGANVSIVISGVTQADAKGINVRLETYDINLQPLEGFIDRLTITQPDSLFSKTTFDNGSDSKIYTSSTFRLGKSAQVLRVLVTPTIRPLFIGFINVCTDQDITLIQDPPLVDCKSNVNDLQVSLSIQGVPREEINIFQAFVRYNILTNTYYRFSTSYNAVAKSDGRIGTAVPKTCNDTSLCNYWKQQGINGTPVQAILARNITENGIEADLALVIENSFNNLRTIDNYIWAAPLNGGFAPDNYILNFGESENRIAEDNFVDILEVFLSMNRAEVQNSKCLPLGSAYGFAEYLTFTASEPLLIISIPSINYENPKALTFRRLSISKTQGITTASYVLDTRFCSSDTILTGAFNIEHHPEDGEFFLIKAYEWATSPKTLFDITDNCEKYTDYSTLYTFGAKATNTNLSVLDDSNNSIFIKPDNASLAPTGPKYWSKRIPQSSIIDLFSNSSSGNSYNIQMQYERATESITAGVNEIPAIITWAGDNAASGTEASLCDDPATQVDVTISYTNSIGTRKRFSQNIPLSQILKQDTINIDDWNQLSAVGNGQRGDFANWLKLKFVLDSPDGLTGLDQCLPRFGVNFTGTSSASFSKFENSSKGTFIPNCTPDVQISEITPGTAQNEIQSLSIPLSNSGFYTLGLDYLGSYTVEVPYNADAAGLRASLASLPNIKSTDNVNVTGLGTGTSPFLIEFIGELSRASLPLLTSNTSFLQSSASGNVTLITTGSASERQRISNTTGTRSPLIISYENQNTNSIAYNASLNTFQATLGLLPSIGQNINVTGNISNRDAAFNGPWDVDFIGDNLGKNMPTLTPIVAGYKQELLWPGSIGVNTKQAIRITATGGYFILTLTDNVGVELSATTDRIPYNASEADLSNAITQAAQFITASDLHITRTETSTETFEWTIEFVGNFAKIPVPLIGINISGLYRQSSLIITRVQAGLGTSEVQRLSLFQVTGGYYYLDVTLNGTTSRTKAIPYDATDIRLEQELTALDFFASGDVIVRRDSLKLGEFKAYNISINESFGNIPLITPVFSGFLICDPTVIIQGPPYDYILKACAANPLSLTNTSEVCKPGPNDNVSPLPVDCCTIAKTGDNTLHTIRLDRELISPNTSLYNQIITIKQLAATRNLNINNYTTYVRDFSAGIIKPIDSNTAIYPGLSLLLVDKTLDTDSSIYKITNHLKNSQELLPTRMLWNQRS